MGLIEFVKGVGRKLHIVKDEPEAAAAPAGGPTPEQVQDVRDRQDRQRAASLAKLIQEMGFSVDELGVRVDGDKTTLTGTVDSQEIREKIVLLVGNTEGTGGVDDQLQVSAPAPEAQYYEVVKGDTLSHIAKHFYGNANKYMAIFEANKPMLKDPDEIYPGQKLRIPPQA
jgi:nucleoid-associated protein YgaU